MTEARKHKIREHQAAELQAEYERVQAAARARQPDPC